MRLLESEFSNNHERIIDPLKKNEIIIETSPLAGYWEKIIGKILEML
jgi:hypothetical protein